MKLAVSSLALPAFDHLPYLPSLRAMGIEGIEIAPERTWTDYLGTIPASSVDLYRRAVEDAELKVIGLHGLLDGRLDLGIFGNPHRQARTLDHLVRMSAVCRDLGGRTLIIERGRQHANPDRSAWLQCREFLEKLVQRIEGHQTVLCFSPVSPRLGEFCHTSHDCYLMASALDHPSFGLHVSSAGLWATGEMGHASFSVLRGRLDHVHIAEPDLSVLDGAGRVDHADLRRHLAAISYRGWISLVQAAQMAPLQAVGRGADFVRRTYLPLDTRRNSHDPGPNGAIHSYRLGA